MVCPPEAARCQESARPSSDAVLFEEVPVVQAATLHVETLERAPAVVTVIGREEIRRYGYRTLSEVLDSVAGLYSSTDRAYHYVGVRGFSLPGDYGSRLIVMINGHYLSDKIYDGSGSAGFDFPIDLELVKRIEVIRGPSSALYGNNGIFATFNIVTISPEEHGRASGTLETGSLGENRVQVSSALMLGRGASLLASVSGMRGRGSSVYLPEFDSPETNGGLIRGADGEAAAHAFLNLRWNRWDITAVLSRRDKRMPIPWSGDAFAGDGTDVQNTRTYLEAVYARDVGTRGNLLWRVFYDSAGYASDAWNQSKKNQFAHDFSLSKWAGSRLAYRLQLPRFGSVTTGLEGSAGLRTTQEYWVYADPPTHLRLDTPEGFFGAFVQHEMNLTRRWRSVVGVRYDLGTTGHRFVSPRTALLYEASPRTVYKFLYGRAFRNPNAYELYYEDPRYQARSQGLRPENADTFEVAVERQWKPRFKGVVSAYHYRIGNLIAAEWRDDGLLQYRNTHECHATGLELQMQGRSRSGFEAGASIAIQRAVDQRGVELPNSPERILKLRAATRPFWQKLVLSGSLLYTGERQTTSQARVSPFGRFDATLSTVRLHRNFDIQLGVRNALDRRICYPTALALEAVPDTGRNVFLRLLWHISD